MPSPAPITLAAVRGSRSIRVGIFLLATVAFVLSYDALRQMAVASHVRGLLTYLFPLVIDGFIAIGIIALLVLRTAPVRSRLYVWTLVGAATGTSISANVVHAIGLNEGTRLHLNNATAGALSAIAPLALAGAVHLYLVINRHLAANSTVAEKSPATPPAASARPPVDSATPRENRQVRQDEADPATAIPAAKARALPRPEAKPSATKTPTAKGTEGPGPRKLTVPDETLLAMAHAIGAEKGAVPRIALEKAVRAKGYTVGKDRAEKAAETAMAELQAAKATAAAS